MFLFSISYLIYFFLLYLLFLSVRERSSLICIHALCFIWTTLLWSLFDFLYSFLSTFLFSFLYSSFSLSLPFSSFSPISKVEQSCSDHFRLSIILSIHPSLLLSLFLLLSFSTLFFLPYFPPCSPVPSLPPVSLSSIYLSFFRSFHLHAVKLEVIIYQRAVDVNAGRRTIKCRLQVWKCCGTILFLFVCLSCNFSLPALFGCKRNTNDNDNNNRYIR